MALLFEQVIHSDCSINAARVHVLFQSVCGDKYCVDGVACFGQMHKGVVALANMLFVVACKREFRLAVFHFAYIDDMVSAA